MGAFLALSILGVGFYVVLLLALLIDGRKSGNHRVNLYHRLDWERGSAPDFANASQVPAASQHRLPLMDDVIWIPVTTVNWQGKETNCDSNPERALRIAARNLPVRHPNSHGACKGA
jgi:hypothetical protein